MLLRDIVYQLHDQDCLAHACSAKQTYLSALQEWLEQIDDFDAGYEHLEVGSLVLKSWSVSMDRVSGCRGYRAEFVDGLTDNVEDPAERGGADWNAHPLPGIDGFYAPPQALRPLPGDPSSPSLAPGLLDFHHHVSGVPEP